MKQTPLAAAVVIASVIPAQLLAADQEPQRAPAGVLEEVIVTAQKRTQTMMEVPISVGVFSGSDIEKTGALDIREMSNYIAGVSVDEGQLTQAGISIRGISSSNISSGGDPSVATFYDGSYLPRSAATIGFSDVERVEVLKGPQGTLFGRNAAAGVVNIVPKKPQDEVEGFVAAKLGNYNLIRLEAMGNVPIMEGLTLRGNVLSNQRDGFLENVDPSGGEVGEQDSVTARASLLWDISDSTDVQLSYDYDKVDQSAQAAIGVGLYAYSSDPFDGKIENDVIAGGERRDMYAVGFKLNHDFNDQWSMNFKASYRDIESENVYDEDGTSDITRYLSADNYEDTDVTYSELQVNFNDGPVNLVFGGSYSLTNSFQRIPVNLTSDSVTRFVTNGINDEFGEFFAEPLDHIWNPDDWATVTGLLGLPNDQSDETYKLVSDFAEEPLIFGPSYAYGEGDPLYNESIINEGEFVSWGLYADIGWEITDKLEVFAGIRYSYDEKEFSWETPLTSFSKVYPELGIIQNNIFPVQEKVVAKEDWDDTTGRLVANYKITEDIMTFVSASTGYKSGGFDSLDVRTAQYPLNPEYVTSYELGLKADFFDKRMRTQISFYDMEVDGAQQVVESLPPDQTVITPRLINTDRHNRGVELTLDWYVLDSLLVGIVTQYTESEQTPEKYYNSEGDFVGGTTSKAKGHPEDAYTLKFDWTPVTPIGDVLFHMDYVYNVNDQVLNLDYLDKYEEIPGYGGDRQRLQGRIDWRSADGVYQVSLWGKNLLDKEYVTAVGGRGQDVFDAPKVSVEDPLTYGVDLRYSF